MAKLNSGISFTGSLGNLSAYTMRGSDKVILRHKGGPSKKKIKNDPNCINVRRNNMEFGGRSSTVKHLNLVLYPLKSLADINIESMLGKMLIPAQKLDEASSWGQRSVLLSRLPQVIEGFDFNSKNSLSSIIRSPLMHNLSRETLTTKVEIPALMPGINFFAPPGQYPLFSMIGVLGAVPDMRCVRNGYEPMTMINSIHCYRKVETPWLPTINGAAAMTFDFSIQQLPPGNDWCMMLAVGIRFATVGADGMPQQIPYTGAAKILAVR